MMKITVMNSVVMLVGILSNTSSYAGLSGKVYCKVYMDCEGYNANSCMKSSEYSFVRIKDDSERIYPSNQSTVSVNRQNGILSVRHQGQSYEIGKVDQSLISRCDTTHIQQTRLKVIETNRSVKLFKSYQMPAGCSRTWSNGRWSDTSMLKTHYIAEGETRPILSTEYRVVPCDFRPGS